MTIKDLRLVHAMSGIQHGQPETLRTASIQSKHIRIAMGQDRRVTSELDIDLPVCVIGIKDPLYQVQVYLLLLGLALPARCTHVRFKSGPAMSWLVSPQWLLP